HSQYRQLAEFQLTISPSLQPQSKAVHRESIALDSAIDIIEAVHQESLAFEPAAEQLLNNDGQLINNEKRDNLITAETGQAGTKHYRFSIEREHRKAEYRKEHQSLKNEKLPPVCSSRHLDKEQNGTGQLTAQILAQKLDDKMQDRQQLSNQRQISELYRGMQINQCRLNDNERNKSILEEPFEPTDPEPKLQSSDTTKIKAKRSSTKSVDGERTGRIDNRRSIHGRFEMDKSLFRYPQAGE
ncbi:MAG: hypothetical protein EZS28_050559, partial [Streblomastix strix]